MMINGKSRINKDNTTIPKIINAEVENGDDDEERDSPQSDDYDEDDQDRFM